MLHTEDLYCWAVYYQVPSQVEDKQLHSHHSLLGPQLSLEGLQGSCTAAEVPSMRNYIQWEG